MSNDQRLLVFDWDGTLLDSTAVIVAAAQAATIDLDIEQPSEARIRGIIGLNLADAIATLFPAENSSFCEVFRQRYRARFAEIHQHSPTELFPEVSSVLKDLESLGYILAIATGKARAGFEREAERTGVEGHFRTTRCADEAPSKPHPAMLLQIMEELDMDAEQTTMIGDTDYDLKMAEGAGVAAVAVSYGAHPKERLLARAPAACLENLTELPAWLQRTHY